MQKESRVGLGLLLAIIVCGTLYAFLKNETHSKVNTEVRKLEKRADATVDTNKQIRKLEARAKDAETAIADAKTEAAAKDAARSEQIRKLEARAKDAETAIADAKTEAAAKDAARSEQVRKLEARVKDAETAIADVKTEVLEASAKANNDDVSLPLVNDSRYVKIFRRDLCKPGSQGESWQAPSATTLPSCPPPMSGEFQGETGKGVSDAQVDWTKAIAGRYLKYSARCNSTGGLMWGVLDKYDVLRWMGRMTDLVFNGRPGEPEVPKKDEQKKSKLNWLDWASGCGANIFYYHASYQNYTKPGAEFHAVGVDITGPAVAWGRQKLRSTYPDADMGADASRVPRVGGGSPNTMRFCHADGTKLEWLPKNSFDVITSLAGLYHLPTAAVCPTMRQLIALLKPKSGRLVTCYVHPEERYMQILNCLHECGEGMKVKGTLIDQHKFVSVEPKIKLGFYSKIGGAACLLLERL